MPTTKKSVLVLREHIQANVGDKCSSPALYYDLGATVEQDLRRATTTTYHAHPVMVIGGGGMFRRQIKPHIRKILSRKGKSKAVLWGCGLNNHKKTRNDSYPDWVFNANLIGVRDWNRGLPWVPCATCGSLSFNKRRDPIHELVIYDHWSRRVPVEIKHILRSSNTAHSNLNGVLDFLGQGDAVLTSSYHGAYWATLLGRRVVVWPFSSRFYYMRHAPALFDGTAWQSLLRKAKRYPEALAECRAANVAHYKRVLALVR